MYIGTGIPQDTTEISCELDESFFYVGVSKQLDMDKDHVQHCAVLLQHP